MPCTVISILAVKMMRNVKQMVTYRGCPTSHWLTEYTVLKMRGRRASQVS